LSSDIADTFSDFDLTTAKLQETQYYIHEGSVLVVVATMAATDSSPPVPVRRKQLKEGMEHLRGFVTVSEELPALDSPSQSAAAEDAYGVPSSLEPLRKPRTNAAENVEKRSDPFQFGSRYLEEGDDVFAFNAWDHVETDEAYKTFAEECYQKQKESPVSEFDRSTYVLHMLCARTEDRRANMCGL
jgi:hypothetical protein